MENNETLLQKTNRHLSFLKSPVVVLVGITGFFSAIVGIVDYFTPDHLRRSLRQSVNINAM